MWFLKIVSAITSVHYKNVCYIEVVCYIGCPLWRGSTVYDETLNPSFSSRIESVQYYAALTMTVAIRGSSRVKLQ